MTEKPSDGLGGHELDIPETDDPVVLRELLRQAREHLRLRGSIERLMAENVARTEALLLDARATQGRASVDPDALRSEIAALRSSLGDALGAVERIDAHLAAPPSSSEPAAAIPAETGAPAHAMPGTVEVLIHEIHSPTLARSLQQHLREADGVSRAEVRELAEGLLRITVDTATPLTEDTIATWEPQRPRTIRTARPDVLEIELT